MGGVNAVLLEFEPYGSMFIIWTAERLPSPPPIGELAPAIDLSTGWDLHLGEKAVKIEKLISWTEIAGMKNFSGVGRYEKTFQMDAATLQKGFRAIFPEPGRWKSRRCWWRRPWNPGLFSGLRCGGARCRGRLR